MKDKLEKLLTVKSIVTILLTLVFCYLSIICVISAEHFLTIFTVIFLFTLGFKLKKRTRSKGNE